MVELQCGQWMIISVALDTVSELTPPASMDTNEAIIIPNPIPASIIQPKHAPIPKSPSVSQLESITLFEWLSS